MLAILSMDSLLRDCPKFITGYMGEALLKGAVNFTNEFYVKRGS